ncbi:hypothetical protein CH63R_03519 [Colletotrichum higginsianum IMI 349063]|uniref:Uncharacterized protein n=2 Tax=Colletotrichum higginsianum TaxID=80884 RepID=A0A1B7YRZ4_COLHI|nr:hypothetical protein CH63R_03519 [Colletotrichum higginsianum IMI 349063]OBR14793.1 hypothetical protein CH63R_03519 [Colletotrichum higginsianum IMI 349063]TID01650.1 hypothetical protein CH35J_004875 [Colletotrichum higginsianum]
MLFSTAPSADMGVRPSQQLQDQLYNLRNPQVPAQQQKQQLPDVPQMTDQRAVTEEKNSQKEEDMKKQKEEDMKMLVRMRCLLADVSFLDLQWRMRLMEQSSANEKRG